MQGINTTQILETINKEIKRRHSIHPTKVVNRQKIKESYKPLHYHLFNPDNIMLHDISKSNIKEELPGVYSFPLLSETVCQEIMMEFAFFKNQRLTHQKPNSMNKNGILLEELGIFGTSLIYFWIIVNKDGLFAKYIGTSSYWRCVRVCIVLSHRFHVIL